MLKFIAGVLNNSGFYKILFYGMALASFFIMFFENSKYLIKQVDFLRIDYPIIFIIFILLYLILYLINPERFISILENIKKPKYLYLILLLISSGLFIVKLSSEFLDQKYITNFLIFFIIFLGLTLWSFSEIIIEKFSKIKLSNYIWLMLIILAGLIIRLIGAYVSNVNLDEGNWIYDAWMIAEGLVPFQDFFSREPIYFYFSSPIINLFGTGVIASRIFSVIFSTLTILFVYLIGKKVKNTSVGLISALVFSLTPAMAIYSWDAGNGPVYILLMSIIFYLFLCFLEKPKLLLIAIIGLLFGLSVHFSRLSIFYYLIFPFIFIFYFLPKHGVKKTYLNYLIFYIFSALGLIPVMLYFINIIGLDAFNIAYGFYALLQGFAAGLILFFIFHLVYKFIYPHKNLWSATKILFLAGLIIFAIYSYFNIGLEHLYKSRIFYNILVQALILVLPLFFLLLGFVKDNFKNKKIAHIFIGLLQTLFILLVYIGWSNLSELELFGARVISNNYEVMFWFVFVFLDGLFLFQLLKNNYLKINNKTLLFPALFLFITPIAFALIHVQHNVSMFKPYILLGSVLLGAMLYSMFKNIRAYSNQLIILFLILAFSLSGFFYIQTNFRDRLWSQELVSQVAEYINVNTKDEEEIFTAGTIFATQANQRIALDISHPLIYGDGHVDMADYSGIESVPAPQEIADYLEENVNIIIMDHRTRALFDNNEELKKLLDEGVYKKSDQIDIIKIYRKD